MTARSTVVERLGHPLEDTGDRVAWLAWAVPVALFVVAAAVRLVVATLVPFPATEGSAYYLGVARNIIDGEGLVTDSLWSYATPPLTVPRPAFELWMPMSSFLAAAGMSLLGSTYWAAQVATAFVGAILAPLTWSIARSAASSAGLDPRRATAVAFASGLLVAIGSPFVLAAAVPDSSTPYVVASVTAAWLVPGLLSPDRVPVVRGLAVGFALGLAYLARQEVVWLGLAVVVAAWLGRRPVAAGIGGERAGGRDARSEDRGVLHPGAMPVLAATAAAPPSRTAPTSGTAPASRTAPPTRTAPLSRIAGVKATFVRLLPVVAGGLLVVLPWLARNAAAFGTPFPGQTLENAILRRNEEIYAFAQRPTLAGYLDQGLAALLGNPVAAAWDALVNVVVIPAFPLGVAGLVAVIALRRSPAFHLTGALGVLLLSGFLTLAATVVLFPVATRWGTFLHASGPLLVGLTVAAVLGGDALLARISAIRAWPKPNVIVAPIALVAVTVMLLALQVLVISRQARELEGRYAGLSTSLEAASSRHGHQIPEVLISDHPIWVTEALRRPSVALPDEDLGSIARLGNAFGTSWLLVMDQRGRYPDALLAGVGRRCLADEPIRLADTASPSSATTRSGWLFILQPGCGLATEAGA